MLFIKTENRKHSGMFLCFIFGVSIHVKSRWKLQLSLPVYQMKYQFWTNGFLQLCFGKVLVILIVFHLHTLLDEGLVLK